MFNDLQNYPAGIIFNVKFLMKGFFMSRFLRLFMLCMMFLLAGCGGVDRSSCQGSAELFVTAIASEDKDVFWESFAPSVQAAVIRSADGDIDRAKDELFDTFSRSLKEKYQLREMKDILRDEKLMHRITGDLLAGKDNKFVKIDDLWYIGLVF